MTSAIDFWQQLHASADQHLPAGTVPALAGGIIGLGVLVSVLGAKLARPALALLFLGIGTSLAGQFGDRLPLPYPIMLAIGAGVGGAVGYALYRLWVGLAMGVLLACVAGMVLGHGHILSAIEELHQTAVAGLDEQSTEFVLQSPAAQAEYWRASPGEMAAELWHNIQAQSPVSASRIPVAATLAGIAGLLFGLFAARVAVILGTAALGTALLCFGTATLAQQFRPDVLDQLLGREGALLVSILGVLAASAVLQVHLTRRPRGTSEA